jgi:hypothetical protein
VRPAQAVMAELAAAGLTAAQLALIMELSAAVATEARPTIDQAAENKRAYDREYRKAHPRTKSYDNNEPNDSSPDGSPKDIYQTPSLAPVSKTEAKASLKSPVQREKLEAIGSCLRVAFPPPPEVADGVWADFLRSPKRRKAGMSQTAYAGICRNLIELAEHGFPPGEMIALAVERGWTTVKLDWVLNTDERKPRHGQSSANVTSLRGSRPDPALDMWRAAIADENEENNLRAGPALPALGSGGP